MIRVTFNQGDRINIATGYYCVSEHWDSRRGLCFGQGEESVKVNRELTKIIRTLNENLDNETNREVVRGKVMLALGSPQNTIFEGLTDFKRKNLITARIKEFLQNPQRPGSVKEFFTRYIDYQDGKVSVKLYA